ncbi:MAG: carboxypeptidase M32, partial [Nitrospinae bacterium CG11_big_fil_rev_8_21_14_0_20_56_8]
MNPKIMTPRAYLKLEDLFKKINVLHGIAALLRWDAAVMMPKGSSFIRGDQLAVIDAEIHSLINSKRLSFLLDRAEAHAGDLDDWQGANLVIMRRLWVRARALPKRLITALNRATVTADQRWREAKESNNFKRLAPALEKVVNLTREKAEILSLKMGVTPYEALLDEYDPYRRSEEVETLFKELHHLLPPMIYRVIERQADWSPPPAHLFIPKVRQQHLARKIMKTMGFPFNNGRLDESPHPFTEGPPGDIRMTTCYDPNDIMKGLMGVLHETGHALYDFGLPHQWIHQPVGRDMGMTIHESQALLMEMVVGRTRGFFIFAAPLISRI